MKLYLYRCPTCSSVKLFTEKQIEEFPGGFVCTVHSAFHDSCDTIMEKVEYYHQPLGFTWFQL